MKAQVSEFIEKQRKKCLKRRNNHLIRLGLVDLNKAEKHYASESLLDWQREEYGYVYKDEHGYYKYVGDPVALSVTDEEYLEICKYCPPEKEISDTFEKRMLEKVDILRKMMKFFVIVTAISLAISIIVGIIIALG